MSNEYTLSKEQAYHAYETYQNETGNPVVSFDSFDDSQYATWQKVGNVFSSFTAIPCSATQAAA